MPDENATQDPGGQQPEAERSLEAAARSGSKKPDGQGTRARGDTAPEAGSLEQEEGAAADILKGNAEKDTGAG